MTEEQVFLAVLDLPDATARVAYLDETCGKDAEFRRQVEALLAAHFRTGEFLDVPAAEQVHAGSKNDNTVAIEGDAVSAAKDSEDESDDLNFLSPSTRPDSLGRLGHYEMLQVLGKGGFGIVFRAFDDMLQRVVAVKVMAPQIAILSPARKRFLREARSSAAIRHENVVQVYEVGEQPLPYLVMEFIPGETLQQKLDRSGPLDVPEVLRIGRQVAEGLAAAHASDLIHRDIKPSNVLLEGGSQKAKITDFGLARAADDASISQSGIIAGTPMFMAPEQALGHKIDQRADLFSLGSVLYQMVSGRPPFRAPSALAILKRVAEETPRPIPEIIPETPDWLCGIIAKLHAKNPDERFQSAREVADLLADCEAKLKAKQEVKNVLPAAVKPTRWKWVAAAAVLLLPVLVLAVTEFAGVTHLFRGQQPTLDPIKPNPDPALVGKKQAPPDADGWVQLFNGKDLTGWKAAAGSGPADPSAFRVLDGLLVAHGKAARLRSERTNYADFHFRVEAKLEQGASAFQVFRGGVASSEHWGYEAYLRLSSVKMQCGSLYIMPKGAKFTSVLQEVMEKSIEPDTWFTQEVIAKGSHIEIKVNGKTVVNMIDATLAMGDVGIDTVQAGTIHFKKIEIKELLRTPVTKPEPLPPTFKNSIGMEFVVVPKGKSWLGGSKDALGDNEVEIPADFYLGKYMVTQEEWEKVMGENPSYWSRTGDGKDAVKDIPNSDLKRFPVEMVSWGNCQLFVEKLNRLEKETGWVYRLPKEAEWEYACRGGPMSDKLDSAFDFYFAKPTNTLLPEQANFEHGNGLKRTCKVGSYEPNKLGLFDMHGNVWAWCDNTLKASDGASYRVVRGGSWFHDSGYCRAAYQFGRPPSFRSHGLGLRLARVPSGAPSPEAKMPPP